MISIIVPIYNVEKYIEKCLNSLKNQTYTELEIILVNDGSSDKCGEICDSIVKLDKRFKVIHKQNGGVSSAWQAGVKNAKGEYIGFVDPDDYVEKDYFEVLLNGMINNKADIVICGHVIEEESQKNIIKAPIENYEFKLYLGQELEELKLNINDGRYITYAKWNRLFKREIVLANFPLYDERLSLGDDIAITLASIYDSKSLLLMDYYGYHYLNRKSSITHSFNVNLINNLTYLFDNITNVNKVKGYGNNFNIDAQLSRQVVTILGRILKSDNSNKEKKAFFKILKKNNYVKDFNYLRSNLLTSKKTKILLILFKLNMFSVLCFISRYLKG